jgi:hypothetical protein
VERVDGEDAVPDEAGEGREDRVNAREELGRERPQDREGLPEQADNDEGQGNSGDRAE